MEKSGTVIIGYHPTLLVILILFQDNKPPSRVMLKQVHHDEVLGIGRKSLLYLFSNGVNPRPSRFDPSVGRSSPHTATKIVLRSTPGAMLASLPLIARALLLRVGPSAATAIKAL